MTAIRNVLFVMCDQLRWDYLGCTGHPHLRTPNIDWLAAQGTLFSRAYVQSPICGPSRMSFYTGRYVRSHGSSWNNFPLRVGEMTLGDHLAPLGVRTALVGKTHMAADRAGMARLGIDPESAIGVRVAQCGFEPYERHDGLHPNGYEPSRPAYDAYLRAQGSGSFINIASTAALRPRPGLVWYNGTKGAVVTISKGMAAELGPDNIRVNCINPVIGDTALLEQFMGMPDTPENRSRFLAGIPLGRFCTPKDVAAAALYLASDEAEFITGTCIEVDGGRCI